MRVRLKTNLHGYKNRTVQKVNGGETQISITDYSEQANRLELQ